ncbi:MAG: HDOD domain-containing protein [Lachnospiraceae bacterium]|jgi:EAL and modified HD-GYP domain-containing signal transduction protein|nr:HDOD domain-containing protein [Lachnospiraceae bacterium]
MLATLVPLFDQDMRVKAYSLFGQKKNFLLDARYLSGAQYDAVNVPGFEIIDSIGIQTLSKDAEIFVPVTNISIYGDINSQCKVPRNRIVLLMDTLIKPELSYINRIAELKKDGYKFAIRKLNVSDFEAYKEILKQVDYVILNHQKIVISKAKIYFSKLYPNVSLVAGNLQSQEIFEELKAEGGYQFFEGGFYRMPVTKGDNEVAPLKFNYIQLLNLVNSPDFDLTDAADIIGRDTALVMSLLEIVNKMAVNSEITSIKHAASMLGQRELRKWITTAITKELCTDKPSEITRLSLLRAKFAENLAPLFEMAGQSQELFLMGLFSVIDLVLDVPMSEALKMMNVSKNISAALVDKSGAYYEILYFMECYEAADWQEISRIMLLDKMDEAKLSEAYINTLEWYRDLF